MFHRVLNPLKSNSFFLFGARGTGKSTFLKEFFEGHTTYWIDLLEAEQEFLYSQNLGLFKQQVLEKLSLDASLEWVVLDEVQKVPYLLDTVHQLIESTPLKFALTGSSARKLKRGGANLLAGRAFLNMMFPLTAFELAEKFNLTHYLKWGGLPKIYSFSLDLEKQDYLKTYVYTYLKEEIVSEQIIRQLDPFRRYLEIAAQGNGEILNYSNIARDVGVDTKTVQSYYQILEDTLLGFFLQPYHKSIRKQQRQAPKFYLFDLGVKRALDHTLSLDLLPNTYAFGRAFEHFVISECHRLNDYFRKDYRFYYLRTKDQLEIDLIIERPGKPLALVEIKSSNQVDERDVKTLKNFIKDLQPAEGFCLSQDPYPKLIEEIHCLPWQEGLQQIGLCK